MSKVPLENMEQAPPHHVGFEGPPPPYNPNDPGMQKHHGGHGGQYPQALGPQVMTTTVIVQAPLGPESVRMQCPHCHADISTETDKTPSSKAWIVGLVLGFFCLCLACIPCCMDDCQTTKHNCPNCKAYLGKFDP